MSSIIAGVFLLAAAFGAVSASAQAVRERTSHPIHQKITRVKPKTVRITVDKNGFSPSSISVEKGSSLTLIFNRTTEEGCGSKVVFPSLNISRNLPVGKSVTIKITPAKTGEIAFSCGMGMYKGNIVVQ